MTGVKPWPWPAYRVHPTIPDDDQGAREYAVEAYLRLGSMDGGREPDVALSLINRLVRPDATIEYVAAKVADLIQLSNDTADAEVIGGRADLDIAADAYAAVLYDFTVGPQRPVGPRVILGYPADAAS